MKEKKGILLKFLYRFSHTNPSKDEVISGFGSVLELSVKDIVSSKNGNERKKLQDPYSSKQAFDVADDIKKRRELQDGLSSMSQAVEEYHRDVSGEVPAQLESIPGVLVFKGERPRNDKELGTALVNNKELRELVSSLQEKGKNVWAEANAHKGVVLTVAAISAGVIGATGIYLHHKNEQDKIKRSGLIFKKK